MKDFPFKISATSIEIRGLRIFARHGLFPQEQAVGNDYIIDATLAFDASQAIHDDLIGHTIDYGSAVSVIRTEMAIHSDLLENVAGRMARKLLSSFPLLESGTITITKIKPPIPSSQVEGIAFTLSFGRE